MLWEDDTMASLENVSNGNIRLKQKRAASDIVFKVFLYVFLSIFAFITLYPVFSTLAYSLSDGTDSIKGGIHFFPRVWSLKSYEALLFKRESIWRGAAITAARTVIGTFLGVFANALLAYIISRRKFIFRSGLSLFWIITIYAQAGIIPTLYLYRKMYLTQTFWVYVIPGLVSGLYLIVMRTYMKNIPESLEEAAQLEGAGYMRIFWSIISPLCKPVYAAIALFIATTQWNSWFDAYLYNKFEYEYTTLQFEIFKYFNTVTAQPGTITNMHQPRPYPITPQTLRSALAILSMLPLMIAYPFLQKYFVSGLTVRGIKD